MRLARGHKFPTCAKSGKLETCRHNRGCSGLHLATGHYPWAWGLFALLACLAAPGPVQACNVPVFRYALERWFPEPYEVLIFHHEPLAAADQVWLDSLKKYAADIDCPTNFSLRLVNLSTTKDQGLLKLFKEQRNAALPWLLVQYPEDTDSAGPVFAGRFEPDALRKLLDSPARREIAKRLLQGESAVWLLLESGDKTKDDLAADKLQTELRALERTLKLPELTDSPKDKLLLTDGPALRIGFSVLRLSRTDPAEAMFVRMLLNSEEGLAGRKEPMVFPIYGRGIALYAIVGKGLTSENCRAAATYIVGACSCEARKLNHGTDLLFTEDWEGKLRGRLTASRQVPPLTSLVKTEPPAAEFQAALDEESSSPSLVVHNIGLVLGGGLGLILAGSLVIFLLYRRIP
jgi:hypothetical protein